MNRACERLVEKQHAIERTFSNTHGDDARPKSVEVVNDPVLTMETTVPAQVDIQPVGQGMLTRPQSLGISRLPNLSDVGQNGLSFLTQRRGVYPRRLGVSTTSHDASSEEGEKDPGSRRESLTATARHGSCVTQTTGHVKKDASGSEVTLVCESSPIPDSGAFPEPSLKESTALAYDVARNRDSASA
ncbi:hypothetical protein FGB62_35g211 [Gracilaria domingensis]|nr:hypothetical protein FGB62_35g211 [Gracilaria domingensis]